MGEESSIGSQIYRAGIHLFAIIGVFAAFFVALGAYIAVNHGEWTYLAVVVAGVSTLFLLLRVLRLEITSAGFKYRNLSGSREVLFTEIRRAYFEVMRADVAPQGVAAFWIERRDGARLKVNLRTFSVEAAAVLFNALEAHGIQIEVPDAGAARRMAREVRAAQRKLLG